MWLAFQPLPVFILMLAGTAGLLWVIYAGIRLEMPVGWMVLTCLAGAAPLFSASIPQISLAAYLLLAYGTRRYSDGYEMMLQTGVLDVICTVSLIGWAIWCARKKCLPPWRSYLFLAMVAFVVWVGLSWVIAAYSSPEFAPYSRHHPIQFVHGFILFLIASNTLRTPQATWFLAAALCLLIVVRGALQGSARLYLESDTTVLAAMLVPLAIIGARHTHPLTMRVLFGIGALGLLAIVTLGQNRAAGVALVSALATMLWYARRKLRTLIIGAIVAVAIFAVLPWQGYLQRFSVLWNPSADHSTADLDRATIRGRFTLWRSGWEIASDHPWFGVGPGNFAHANKGYRPRAGRLPTHSNYLNIAAETGFPGLALYLGVFACVIVTLNRVLKEGPNPWPAPGAQMLQASLIAYLAFGLFLSRHDMALAYLLAGWALALASARVSRPPKTLDRRASQST